MQWFSQKPARQQMAVSERAAAIDQNNIFITRYHPVLKSIIEQDGFGAEPGDGKVRRPDPVSTHDDRNPWKLPGEQVWFIAGYPGRNKQVSFRIGNNDRLISRRDASIAAADDCKLCAVLAQPSGEIHNCGGFAGSACRDIADAHHSRADFSDRKNMQAQGCFSCRPGKEVEG